MNTRWNFFALLLIGFVIFFRFFALDAHPNPYWEEVALGFDAYSVVKTGRDHHGNFLPLTAFESFGDYKPSLYFYVLTPFIALFGLEVWVVRLPTVIASIFVIWGTAYFARQISRLFFPLKQQAFIFWSAWMLGACSPWLMSFSRSAWESMLASALIIWGVNWLLLFWEGARARHLVFALASLVASTYAYHAARVTAPLIMLSFVLCIFLNGKKLTLLLKKVGVGRLFLIGSIALLAWLPIAHSMFLGGGQQRIAQTSIFNDLEVITYSNEMRTAHDNVWWARLIYHRYVLFATQVTQNFVSHFDFNYLFVNGDHNPRHSTQVFGEFYYFDLPFLILGVFFVWKKSRLAFFVLFLYLFAAILPASMTKSVPHALRTLAAWPVFITVLSYGVYFTYQKLRDLRFATFIFGIAILLYGVSFVKFFQNLVSVYPDKYKHEWQFGYKEMVGQLEQLASAYDHIYITREYGRPGMYYFFYTQTDPHLVQEQADLVRKDQGEFLEFQNISFIDQKNEIDFSKKFLLISSQEFITTHFQPELLHTVSVVADQTWIFSSNEAGEDVQ